MKTRCLIHRAVGKAEVAEYDLRDPKDNEVIVELEYTCVSPGTELRCLAGKQQGQNFPYISGYAGAGRVMKAGPASTLKEGTPVFCRGTNEPGPFNRLWGGHVSHALITDQELFVAPDSLSLLNVSLAKLGAIAFHGYLKSKPLANEKVQR